MNIRERLARGIGQVVEAITAPPYAAELWPDEPGKLATILDHIDGLDRRPAERTQGRDTVVIRDKSNHYVDMVVRRWTRPPAQGIRTKATGRQLVRYARYVVVLSRSLAARGVPISVELADVVDGLDADADVAESIVRLRGEVL